MRHRLITSKFGNSKLSMKNILFFSLIVILTVFLTACSSASTPSENEKKSIVGTWQNDRDVEDPPSYFVTLNLENNDHFELIVEYNPDRYVDTSERTDIKGIYLYDGKVLELKVDEADNSNGCWRDDPDMFFDYTLSDDDRMLTLNNSKQFLNNVSEPLELIKVYS